MCYYYKQRCHVLDKPWQYGYNQSNALPVGRAFLYTGTAEQMRHDGRMNMYAEADWLIKYAQKRHSKLA